MNNENNDIKRVNKLKTNKSNQNLKPKKFPEKRNSNKFFKSSNLKQKPEQNSQIPSRGFFEEANFIETSREANVKISGVENASKFEFNLKRENKLARQSKNEIPTKIFALGGIEEIGKNMYCIEHDDEIIIVDCGVKFANKKELPGISGIIPSFSYLKENEKKVKALIITHGHEDHIGGVAYLLKSVNIDKIYSPVIASELIKRKISEHKIDKKTEIELFSDDSVFYTKNFTIDFYRVNHSIPDSFGLSVSTPNGVIATSGDFRFDFASHGDKTNLNKISRISNRKVDVLLCESTNAEQVGFNESEENIVKELNNIISSASGRVIITSFASNLGRVEEIIRIGVKRNRKAVILGRSMDANITASRKVGYLKLDEKFLVAPRDVNQYPDNEILIICTGSQGEETAALNTIAKDKHSWIQLKPTDTVILSSNAIPGNYVSVEEVVNRLYKSGVEVFLNSPNLKIHSSGHAAKLEQQLFINVMNPKYLVPIHGEYKMLRALEKNCLELGMQKENILIVSNGQVLHLLNGELTHSEEEVDASEVYIDGHDATLEGNDVVKDRFELGERGLVVCHVFLNSKKKTLYFISPITTAGSFYAYEVIDFLKKVTVLIKDKIEDYLKNSPAFELNELRKRVANLISYCIWKYKNNKPIVRLIITDLDEDNLEKIHLPLKKIKDKKVLKNQELEQVK